MNPLPPSPPRHIGWFLTAHGYGHGVRAAALSQRIPEETEISFYTTLPEAFFREEMRRVFRVASCELDCGCVQPDSMGVDILATLKRYSEIDSRRELLINMWSERVRDEGVDLLIGDIPPLAFPIGRRAGLPALALCNFSWADIYEPYVEIHRAYKPMLERMWSDYSQADLHLRLFPALGRRLTTRLANLGLVCRDGATRRSELGARLGLDAARKWCLIYLGGFGVNGIEWERLRDFPDWEFLGLYPAPGAPSNYHFITKDQTLSYGDLTASADVVLGKLGYSLVAECLAYATRVLFIGPSDFAEFPVLKRLVEERDLGLEVPLGDLRTFRLQSYLHRVSSLQPRGMEALGVGRFLEMLGFGNRRTSFR